LKVSCLGAQHAAGLGQLLLVATGGFLASRLPALALESTAVAAR